MRHLKDHRKLGRTASHRKAMLRNMVTSLIQHERIETTIAKAKELRRCADQMVTLGKKGTLHARRQALQFVRDSKTVQKLFTNLAVRFQDRSGGYTRIYRIGNRHGDNAPMVIIEYLGAPLKRPKKVKGSELAAEKKQPAKKEKKAAPKKKEKEKKETKKVETVEKKTKESKSEKETSPKKPKKVGLLQKIRGRKKADKKKA